MEAAPTLLPAALRANARTYEQQLSADPRWALEDASLFFEGSGAVNRTLRNIAARLDELQIPYVVCGGLALFAHGFRRFTEDVDLLVTAEGLKRIHEQLVGRGYLPPFEKSKQLRDTETKVKIEFLTTGQYPGDGKPKPVAFPDPDDDVLWLDGIRYAGLKTLVQLKLASGMTGQGRQKDLVDVQELIRVLSLPQDFAGTLDPYVADQFDALWRDVRGSRKFVLPWRKAVPLSEPGSISELADAEPANAELLRQMQADGVVIALGENGNREYVMLVTTDAAIAAKYGFEDERDTWGLNELPGSPQP